MQTQVGDYAKKHQHKKLPPTRVAVNTTVKKGVVLSSKPRLAPKKPVSFSAKTDFWDKFQFTTSQKLFLGLLTALCLIGLFFVFEASTAESFTMVGHPYHFLNQQSKWMVIGCICFVIGWWWPIRFWQRTAIWWYAVALIALVAVFLPIIGLKLNGAHRWINLGFTVFQPAEFLKFSLIVFFASWLSKHQRMATFLLFLGIPAGLILLQPDLGSLLVVLGIAFGQFYLAHGSLKKLLPIFGLGLVVLVIAIILSPYRLARVTTFLNPEADPLGKGFHVRQVTLALGNGGWFGKGLGNSTQKYLYIPEASSDSIFAIVAEEIGFVGSTIIILMMLTMIIVVFRMVTAAPEKSFNRLLGQGLCLWFMAQVILNLAAVVALVPLTGIPLPFFSYGGSSLLMIFFMMGLILQLSQQKIESST